MVAFMKSGADMYQEVDLYDMGFLTHEHLGSAELTE
jgi:hypothetical protein